MSYHEVALGDNALDVDAHLWILRDELLCAFDKCSSTVRRVRIVLDVSRSDVLRHRICWFVIVESAAEKRHHCLLVFLQVCHCGFSLSRLSQDSFWGKFPKAV